jgi:hypothetical protein
MAATIFEAMDVIAQAEPKTPDCSYCKNNKKVDLIYYCSRCGERINK